MLCVFVLPPPRSQRQTDMDGVRRFLREDLGLGIDRILSMGTNSRFLADDADIMDALHEFMHLAAGMLKYRQQLSTAVLPELDADLVQVNMALLATLNCHKPLYARTSYTPLPQQFLVKHDLPAETPSQEECWVEPRFNNADVLAVDGEDMQEDLEEENAWFTHLANTFGQLGGFDMMIEVRSSSSRCWWWCCAVVVPCCSALWPQPVAAAAETQERRCSSCQTDRMFPAACSSGPAGRVVSTGRSVAGPTAELACGCSRAGGWRWLELC
jgi:hypothetical protein